MKTIIAIFIFIFVVIIIRWIQFESYLNWLNKWKSFLKEEKEETEEIFISEIQEIKKKCEWYYKLYWIMFMIAVIYLILDYFKLFPF